MRHSAAIELIVEPSGFLQCGAARYACVLGRSGVRAAKREGDGATPAGLYPLRQVLYRADRWPAPYTQLPVSPIGRDCGWCDDPQCADYNRLVPLPHAGSHERLMRDDRLYDLLAVIGYNDDPIRAGLGSAIFLHVAAEDRAPTKGCVALAPGPLAAVIAACDPGSTIRIIAP